MKPYSRPYVHQLSRNLYKVSNHSPLLNQKMIPFMSSVTCHFEPVDSPVSEHEQHQNCLTDIVESWGFQLHPIPGDGNCCFYALTFSIHAQRQDIEQKLPQLFADLGTGLADIAHQLSRIAVDEWMYHQMNINTTLMESTRLQTRHQHFCKIGTFWDHWVTLWSLLLVMR